MGSPTLGHRTTPGIGTNPRAIALAVIACISLGVAVYFTQRRASAGPTEFGPPALAETGQAARALRAPSDTPLVWHDDGAERIVFAAADGLYSVRTDGAGRLRMTQQRYDTEPEWSPDGAHVAFCRYTNGQRDVFVLGAGEGAPVNLTKTPDVSENAPTWSPTGSPIAYITDGSAIEALDWPPATHSMSRELLPKSPEGDLTADLNWSPDGRYLAFIARRDRFQDWSIYQLHSVTGEVTRLTGGDGAADGTPVWSPDGSTILFGRTLTEGRHAAPILRGLFSLSLDGYSGPTMIAERDFTGGCLSPDGGRAVLRAATPGGSGLGLRILDLRTGEEQRLTYDGLWPDWRPERATGAGGQTVARAQTTTPADRPHP